MEVKLTNTFYEVCLLENAKDKLKYNLDVSVISMKLWNELNNLKLCTFLVSLKKNP